MLTLDDRNALLGGDPSVPVSAFFLRSPDEAKHVRNARSLANQCIKVCTRNHKCIGGANRIRMKIERCLTGKHLIAKIASGRHGRFLRCRCWNNADAALNAVFIRVAQVHQSIIDNVKAIAEIALGDEPLAWVEMLKFGNAYQRG